MTDVLGMHHVALATEDLSATVKFYQDVIGLEVGATPSSSGTVQWMYAGDDPVLHIFQPKIERNSPAQKIYGIAHLALHISDFNAAKLRLDKFNIEFSENSLESQKARQLFFDGPDGVRVELIEFE